jgi:hypothetical protein
LRQELIKLHVTDADESHGAPFTFKIIQEKIEPTSHALSLPLALFDIDTNTGCLHLIQKPNANLTYIVHVRCFDTGLTLYSDTYITVRITDELSNEPKMNHTQLDIMTIGGGGHSRFDDESKIYIKSNATIGQLMAYDTDDNDELRYDLDDDEDHHTQRLFLINKRTGLVHSLHELTRHERFQLRAKVTDRKSLVAHANLNINVESLSENCLAQSLFIKFSFKTTQKEEESSVITKLISQGYLRRFKETIVRLINYQKLKVKTNNLYVRQMLNYTRLNVAVFSLRVVRSNGEDDTANIAASFDEDPQAANSVEDEYQHLEAAASNEYGLFSASTNKSFIVELLFSVKTEREDSCLNGMFISKLLNKRKSLIVKKVKMPQSGAGFNVII